MPRQPAWDLFHQATTVEGRNSERLWERFTRGTYPEVRRMAGWNLRRLGASRRLGDVMNVEDVAVETYGRLFVARRTVRDPRTWSFKVIRFIVIEWLRDEPEKRLPLEVGVSKFSDEDQTRLATVPEDDYEGRRPILHQRLRNAIRLLPVKRRRIIIAHYYCGIPRDELPAFFGIKRNSVTQMLLRAHEELEQRLAL